MERNRRRTTQRRLLREQPSVAEFDQRLRDGLCALAGTTLEDDQQVAADDRDRAQRHLATLRELPAPLEGLDGDGGGNQPDLELAAEQQLHHFRRRSCGRRNRLRLRPARCNRGGDLASEV